MMAAWFLLFAATVAAQTAGVDQTGGVTGVVTDAVSHLPVKKAVVSANAAAGIARIPGSTATVTDASGGFAFTNLQPGSYHLFFQHQNYPGGPQGVSKRIEVKAGEVAGPVTVELIPSAAVSGHVVDEDGEPMQGCTVYPRSAKNPEQGVPMANGGPTSNAEGEYRGYGIPPGKYIFTAECGRPVFQPRPFSAGPDPPPSQAYPMQYYPMTTEAKSAEAVELLPGSEKAGIDFRMRPAPVTQVRGAFSPSGADWHGNNPMMIQLVGLDRPGHFIFPGQPFDQAKGTFEFQQVFPGSYILAAASSSGEIGAAQRIEVSDRPVAVTLELRHGLDLSGILEIDKGGNASSAVTPSQLRIRLMPEREIGVRGAQTPVSEDGSFVLRGVLPGPMRLQVEGSNCFLKSAWLGNTDVTNSAIDLSGGAAGALRIVVSTNTATVRGSAPVGESVAALRLDEDSPNLRYTRMTPVTTAGQYDFTGLPPGKYRIALMEPGASMPDDGGEEVAVKEGETVMLDLKAKPSQ